MKHFALPLMLGILTGCDRQTPIAGKSRAVSVESCQELSPKDLGIQKQRFMAFPKANEVAIFRSRNRSQLEPHENQTYDQIYWTNGGQATNDVVIAPLSFYLGYQKPEANRPELLFRDSWRLQAGGYGYDIKEYTFVGSEWSSSAEKATGRVVYSKNNATKSKDLIFEFEMFVLPISEAKRLHRELGKIEKGTMSWQAAFPLKENEGQDAPSNGG